MKFLKIVALLFIALFFSAPLDALYNGIRASSYPYLTGDTIREHCEYIFDDDSNFEPEAITQPSLIFVQTEYLADFFTVKHPHITAPYVLVTHNSDLAVPANFVNYLNDPKLIHWFGQNPSLANHPKFTPLPIGLANLFWAHGNISAFDKAIKNYSQESRDILLYLNFSQVTITTEDPSFKLYKQEREEAFDVLSAKTYVKISGHKSFEEYLGDVAHSCFVACPQGHGLDTHRIWEALLMGAYPIVKSSPLDPLFKELPVLIVNSWHEVTTELLIKKYNEFSSGNFNREKLYAPYWFNVLDAQLKNKPEKTQLPEPYKSLKTLPYKEHSFFGEQNRKSLENIIKYLKPRTVVELGSWFGSSTMFIASQLQSDCTLYAVDTWQGSPEHFTNPEWSQLLSTLYVQFLSNIKHKNLAHIIVPLRMTTQEAARDLEVKPDLVYVDAAHEEDAVYRDIMDWYPKLKAGGIMCGDDWSYPSVVRAVMRAAHELSQEVVTNDNFWSFEAKPRPFIKFKDYQEALALVKPYLPANPVILEAGAYNGKDSVRLSTEWPFGHVHTFEPVPELFQEVAHRIKPYPNITAYQLALADKVGEATFYLSEYSFKPGVPSESSSLLPPKEHLSRVSFVLFNNKINVATTTIDAWAEQNNINSIDFMWLDMQGYELPALKAAPKILASTKALLTEIEFVEAYEGQALYTELKAWLEDQGFEMIAQNDQNGWFGDALFVRKELLKK